MGSEVVAMDGEMFWSHPIQHENFVVAEADIIVD